MSKLDNFVSRLSKAKRTGKDSWIACCPAHDDKSPSMTIREAEDGKLLIHCFAECSIENIIGALGLGFDDIMPDRVADDYRKARKIPFSPSDVLACVKTDSMMIYLALCDLDKGIELSKDRIINLKKASGRIYSAAELGGQ
jgi:hypothetical protein